MKSIQIKLRLVFHFWNGINFISTDTIILRIITHYLLYEEIVFKEQQKCPLTGAYRQYGGEDDEQPMGQYGGYQQGGKKKNLYVQ